tara:strand:+ start:118 stop:1143 length:1026 start_codon:yes stop_codon:yes gene_type:complete
MKKEMMLFFLLNMGMVYADKHSTDGVTILTIVSIALFVLGLGYAKSKSKKSDNQVKEYDEIADEVDDIEEITRQDEHLLKDFLDKTNELGQVERNLERSNQNIAKRYKELETVNPNELHKKKKELELQLSQHEKLANQHNRLLKDVHEFYQKNEHLDHLLQSKMEQTGKGFMQEARKVDRKKTDELQQKHNVLAQLGSLKQKGAKQLQIDSETLNLLGSKVQHLVKDNILQGENIDKVINHLIQDVGSLEKTLVDKTSMSFEFNKLRTASKLAGALDKGIDVNQSSKRALEEERQVIDLVRNDLKERFREDRQIVSETPNLVPRVPVHQNTERIKMEPKSL